jgi:outer membrane receptor for ferrienterochelin and colicins
MKKFFLLYFLPLSGMAQEAVFKGIVTDGHQPVINATIRIDKAGKQVYTDEKGRFFINGLQAATSYQVQVSSVGYEKKTFNAVTSADTTNLRFVIPSRWSALNEYVVTGTRTSRRKIENPVAVNVLEGKTFQLTGASNLGQGLCYQPGLRMETDCQTCGFSQLRMNGLAGGYSQLLINSKPVFSSLNSLYGLEQIPANLIDRVEIVRGGGSVLYGASAIAGTVNIITKEPSSNSYQVSEQLNLVNGEATDNVVNANLNMVNEKQNAGISLMLNRRDRQAWDANGDGYTEIPRIKGQSAGLAAFLKPTANDKINISAWTIHEYRRGGNKLDVPADQADQSEERTHDIVIADAQYQHRFSDQSNLMTYLAWQNTRRRHYTGIDHTDGWGNTRNHSINGGLQYNYTAKGLLGTVQNTLTGGFEVLNEYTYDAIPAYSYLIDQNTLQTGFFVQSDWDLTRNMTVLAGARLNTHNFLPQPIVTPRVSLLYKLLDNQLQVRASYASGFKAPQAFEADMHIAFAGGGVSLIRIDPNLKAERSNSFSGSIDYNHATEHYIWGFTLDAFYTRLNNAFALQETGTDGNGNMMLLRINNGYATVQGMTAEFRANYDEQVQLEAAYTIQQSVYSQPVQWSAEIAPEKRFLRTPQHYGYFIVTALPENAFNASVSGVVTGPMLVPHYGGAPGVPNDVLLTSPTFFELGTKLNYTLPVKRFGQKIEFSIGVQNILNAYQKDFDTGPYRDSNYIYGPARPRTYFAGIKISG